MDIRPIRTDEDHRAALAEIEACWRAPAGTDAGDRLDVLIALVDAYEDRRWPIDRDQSFDPIAVLTHAIDELGHTQAHRAGMTDEGSSEVEAIASAEEVQRMLGTLSGREAEVVKLYHLQYLNYRQIGKQLGITENSVGPILAKARQQLRRAAEQRSAT